MNVRFSRSTMAIMAGLVCALMFASYVIGTRVQDAGDRSSLLDTAYAAEVATQTADAVPLGRTSSPVADSQYPASYFPNTETLGSGEMRITALGTGMPNLTRAAQSISFFVELGNGDKFIFDIGSGAMANLFSLHPFLKTQILIM